MQCEAVQAFAEELAAFQSIDSAGINNLAKYAVEASEARQADKIVEILEKQAKVTRGGDVKRRHFQKNKMSIYCVIDSMLRHSKKVYKNRHGGEPYEMLLMNKVEPILKVIVETVEDGDKIRISKGLSKWQQKEWFGNSNISNTFFSFSLVNSSSNRIS